VPAGRRSGPSPAAAGPGPRGSDGGGTLSRTRSRRAPAYGAAVREADGSGGEVSGPTPGPRKPIEAAGVPRPGSRSNRAARGRLSVVCRGSGPRPWAGAAGWRRNRWPRRTVPAGPGRGDRCAVRRTSDRRRRRRSHCHGDRTLRSRRRSHSHRPARNQRRSRPGHSAPTRNPPPKHPTPKAPHRPAREQICGRPRRTHPAPRAANRQWNRGRRSRRSLAQSPIQFLFPAPSERSPRCPPSAAGTGVGEWGRAALPCSCTPRFLAPGPSPRTRAVVTVGRARRGLGRPGHAYPHGRTGIPARTCGRRRSGPPCVRVTLRVVGGRTGTSPRPRGICPEHPPTLR